MLYCGCDYKRKAGKSISQIVVIFLCFVLQWEDVDSRPNPGVEITPAISFTPITSGHSSLFNSGPANPPPPKLQKRSFEQFKSIGYPVPNPTPNIVTPATVENIRRVKKSQETQTQPIHEYQVSHSQYHHQVFRAVGSPRQGSSSPNQIAGPIIPAVNILQIREREGPQQKLHLIGYAKAKELDTLMVQNFLKSLVLNFDMPQPELMSHIQSHITRQETYTEHVPLSQNSGYQIYQAQSNLPEPNSNTGAIFPEARPPPPQPSAAAQPVQARESFPVLNVPLSQNSGYQAQSDLPEPNSNTGAIFPEARPPPPPQPSAPAQPVQARESFPVLNTVPQNQNLEIPSGYNSVTVETPEPVQNSHPPLPALPADQLQALILEVLSSMRPSPVPDINSNGEGQGQAQVNLTPPEPENREGYQQYIAPVTVTSTPTVPQPQSRPIHVQRTIEVITLPPEPEAPVTESGFQSERYGYNYNEQNSFGRPVLRYQSELLISAQEQNKLQGNNIQLTGEYPEFEGERTNSIPRPIPVQQFQRTEPAPAPVQQFQRAEPEPTPVQQFQRAEPEPTPAQQFQRAEPEPTPVQQFQRAEPAPVQQFQRPEPVPTPVQQFQRTEPAPPPKPEVNEPLRLPGKITLKSLQTPEQLQQAKYFLQNQELMLPRFEPEEKLLPAQQPPILQKVEIHLTPPTNEIPLAPTTNSVEEVGSTSTQRVETNLTIPATGPSQPQSSNYSPELEIPKSEPVQKFTEPKLEISTPQYVEITKSEPEQITKPEPEIIKPEPEIAKSEQSGESTKFKSELSNPELNILSPEIVATAPPVPELETPTSTVKVTSAQPEITTPKSTTVYYEFATKTTLSPEILRQEQEYIRILKLRNQDVRDVDPTAEQELFTSPEPQTSAATTKTTSPQLEIIQTSAQPEIIATNSATPDRNESTATTRKITLEPEVATFKPSPVPEITTVRSTPPNPETTSQATTAEPTISTPKASPEPEYAPLKKFTLSNTETSTQPTTPANPVPKTVRTNEAVADGLFLLQRSDYDTKLPDLDVLRLPQLESQLPPQVSEVSQIVPTTTTSPPIQASTTEHIDASTLKLLANLLARTTISQLLTTGAPITQETPGVSSTAEPQTTTNPSQLLYLLPKDDSSTFAKPKIELRTPDNSKLPVTELQKILQLALPLKGSSESSLLTLPKEAVPEPQKDLQFPDKEPLTRPQTELLLPSRNKLEPEPEILELAQSGSIFENLPRNNNGKQISDYNSNLAAIVQLNIITRPNSIIQENLKGVIQRAPEDVPKVQLSFNVPNYDGERIITSTTEGASNPQVQTSTQSTNGESLTENPIQGPVASIRVTPSHLEVISAGKHIKIFKESFPAGNSISDNSDPSQLEVIPSGKHIKILKESFPTANSFSDNSGTQKLPPNYSSTTLLLSPTEASQEIEPETSTIHTTRGTTRRYYFGTTMIYPERSTVTTTTETTNTPLSSSEKPATIPKEATTIPTTTTTQIPKVDVSHLEGTTILPESAPLPTDIPASGPSGALEELQRILSNPPVITHFTISNANISDATARPQEENTTPIQEVTTLVPPSGRGQENVPKATTIQPDVQKDSTRTNLPNADDEDGTLIEIKRLLAHDPIVQEFNSTNPQLLAFRSFEGTTTESTGSTLPDVQETTVQYSETDARITTPGGILIETTTSSDLGAKSTSKIAIVQTTTTAAPEDPTSTTRGEIFTTAPEFPTTENTKESQTTVQISKLAPSTTPSAIGTEVPTTTITSSPSSSSQTNRPEYSTSKLEIPTTTTTLPVPIETSQTMFPAIIEAAISNAIFPENEKNTSTTTTKSPSTDVVHDSYTETIRAMLSKILEGAISALSSQALNTTAMGDTAKEMAKIPESSANSDDAIFGSRALAIPTSGEGRGNFVQDIRSGRERGTDRTRPRPSPNSNFLESFQTTVLEDRPLTARFTRVKHAVPCDPSLRFGARCGVK